MNKDSRGLSVDDRFNLFISNIAIEREMTNIKKPVINIEPIPAIAAKNQQTLENMKKITPLKKTETIVNGNKRQQKSDQKSGGRGSFPPVSVN